MLSSQKFFFSMIAIFSLFLIFGLFPVIFYQAPLSEAQEVNAKAILEQSDAARGNTSGLEWDVTIEAKEKDSVTKRVLKVKAKNDNSLAVFSEPPDIKGQMLLMKKNNMWFIKPGVSKPVSISPRQRLIGGASNADIASTNYANDYNARIIGTESLGGVQCYVMDLKGKTSNVTYDRIKYWVSKDKNLGLKAEFYSISDKLLKTATFKYDNVLEVSGQKKHFVVEMGIVDAVVKDSVTVMTYKNIKTSKIPDSEFNLQTLGY